MKEPEVMQEVHKEQAAVEAIYRRLDEELADSSRRYTLNCEEP